jgi:hypothetical protein
VAPNEILQIAGQFGPSGVFIWYLIWQQRRQDQISEKRIDADIKMTQAMTLLTSAVENLRRVP